MIHFLTDPSSFLRYLPCPLEHIAHSSVNDGTGLTHLLCFSSLPTSGSGKQTQHWRSALQGHLQEAVRLYTPCPGFMPTDLHHQPSKSIALTKQLSFNSRLTEFNTYWPFLNEVQQVPATGISLKQEPHKQQAF